MSFCGHSPDFYPRAWHTHPTADATTHDGESQPRGISTITVVLWTEQ